MAMTTPAHSQFIASLLATPSLPAVTFDVSSNDPDAALLEAWNMRQQSLAEIETRGSYFDVETHSRDQGDIHDAAEETVRLLQAKTTRGILVKLWVALSHCGDGFSDEHRAQSDAVRRADLAEVEGFAVDLDFAPEVVFGAIRDLTAIIEA